jgi:hypothetical protein
MTAAWCAGMMMLALAQPRGELLDRALAIVGGQVIALSDVQTLLKLGLVEGGSEPDPQGVATAKLIDRALMLREVERYAPPDPASELVESRLAVARDRAGSPDAFAAILAAGGMSEQRLRQWIRDDYRISGYLEQRFAAAGTPTDQEILAYYNDHLDEFVRGGLGYDEAAGLIRDRLSAERRGELITDWLSDLRRRTEIVHVKP